jgi:endogenous inhibitor of DNA gyrase (YacG/DUF329 family)
MSPLMVKCPTCRREIDWANADFRPFCSDRCRLIDLGAWLSEQRAIPGQTVDETPGSSEEITSPTRSD